jgi:hypothetical protein
MNHDTPEATAINDTVGAELKAQEKRLSILTITQQELDDLVADRKELLRIMKAIQHNGRIVGMVGFTEWATEAADLAITKAGAKA